MKSEGFFCASNIKYGVCFNKIFVGCSAFVRDFPLLKWQPFMNNVYDDKFTSSAFQFSNTFCLDKREFFG